MSFEKSKARFLPTYSLFPRHIQIISVRYIFVRTSNVTGRFFPSLHGLARTPISANLKKVYDIFCHAFPRNFRTKHMPKSPSRDLLVCRMDEAAIRLFNPSLSYYRITRIAKLQEFNKIVYQSFEPRLNKTLIYNIILYMILRLIVSSVCDINSSLRSTSIPYGY